MRRSEEVAAQSRSERDRGTDYETIKKGDKKEPPANLLKAMARGHPGQAERTPEFRVSSSSGFWLLSWTLIRISPEGRIK